VLVPPAPRQPGRIANLAASAAVAIIALGLKKDPVPEGIPVPEPGLVSKLESLAELGQPWTLVPPGTGFEQAWYAFEGVRADGSRIDLWNGGAVPSDAKPADMTAWYRSREWATYLTRIRDPRFEGYRSYLGLYFCVAWNRFRRTTDRIDAVDIDYMAEPTSPLGELGETPVRTPGWRRVCPEFLPYPSTWWF
jgi:hypothetical protein